MKKFVIILLVLLAGGYGIYYFLFEVKSPTEYLVDNFDRDTAEFINDSADKVIKETDGNGAKLEKETEELAEEGSEMMTINVPKIVYEPLTDIEYVEYLVPKDPAVLKVTYQKLFENNKKYFPYSQTTSYNGYEFESVDINNKIATLRLKGTYIERGDFDSGHLIMSIEYAAFQFDSVDTLVVYENDSVIDWCDYSAADPSESGCDTASRPWIKTRSDYETWIEKRNEQRLQAQRIFGS